MSEWVGIELAVKRLCAAGRQCSRRAIDGGILRGEIPYATVQLSETKAVKLVDWDDLKDWQPRAPGRPREQSSDGETSEGERDHESGEADTT